METFYFHNNLLGFKEKKKECKNLRRQSVFRCLNQSAAIERSL